MEILYFWIEKYGLIKQQGFNLSPEINCEMNVVGDKYCLSIKKTGKLVTKYPFLFFDRKSILNMIFMSELDDDKMAMRPLSKLARDILRQDKYY